VSLARTVGFVGLIVPQLVRLLGVTDYRWLIPSAMFSGGALLALAYTAARSLWARVQVPVGGAHGPVRCPRGLAPAGGARVRLTVDALTLGFPGRVLCRGLSFRILPGQCWAVLGNNGSGKTTLMHVMAGVRRPLAGHMRLGDAPLANFGAAARARLIGLLLQEETTEFWGSVLDYVSLGRYPHRRSFLGYDPQAERLARSELDRMDLSQLAGQSLSTLSGGERQQARLALVLTQAPAIYLLDEPLQHLDLRHWMQALDRFAGLAWTSGCAGCDGPARSSPGTPAL
jgi:iron complex transport system ATP-binding protein